MNFADALEFRSVCCWRFFGRAHTEQFLFYSRPWIRPPQRKRGVKRICDGAGRALLGLGGTLGFRSMSLALMAATWAVYHLVPSTAFIAAHSPTSFNLFPSLLRLLLRLTLCLSFSLFFFLSFSLLYLFILLGRRPLFVPWRAGRLAARLPLDVAPSNTCALETATFDDVQASIQWLTTTSMGERVRERKREKERQIGRYTLHFGWSANFGYSPCQHGTMILLMGLVPYDIFWFISFAADFSHSQSLQRDNILHKYTEKEDWL